MLRIQAIKLDYDLMFISFFYSTTLRKEKKRISRSLIFEKVKKKKKKNRIDTNCVSRCLTDPFCKAVISSWLSLNTMSTFLFGPGLRIFVILVRPALTARNSVAYGSVTDMGLFLPSGLGLVGSKVKFNHYRSNLQDNCAIRPELPDSTSSSLSE